MHTFFATIYLTEMLTPSGQTFLTGIFFQLGCSPPHRMVPKQHDYSNLLAELEHYRRRRSVLEPENK